MHEVLVKKILVVQTAFIGDVILITPLLRAIRVLYSQAIIDVMVVPGAARLLANNPHINDVMSYIKKGSNATSIFKQTKLLREKQYDLAISPHSSGRTHLILYLAGIPMRIGFDRGPAPFLLTDKIKHPQNMHKINKNLALLKLISNKSFPMQTELFPSANEIDTASELLLGFDRKSLIAVAPGSIWATKCWPQQYYSDLIKALSQRGFTIVLIGGDSDKGKCDSIEQEVKQDYKQAQILNLAGKTDLLESASVIAMCRLMICNDSGALHIANAMKVKVFAFFGPTVTSIGYYPYRKGDRVFEVDLDCRPCGSHGGNKCPLKHHNCMQQISVESVLDAIVQDFTKVD